MFKGVYSIEKQYAIVDLLIKYKVEIPQKYLRWGIKNGDYKDTSALVKKMIETGMKVKKSSHDLAVQRKKSYPDKTGVGEIYKLVKSTYDKQA